MSRSIQTPAARPANPPRRVRRGEELSSIRARCNSPSSFLFGLHLCIQHQEEGEEEAVPLGPVLIWQLHATRAAAHPVVEDGKWSDRAQSVADPVRIHLVWTDAAEAIAESVVFECPLSEGARSAAEPVLGDHDAADSAESVAEVVVFEVPLSKGARSASHSTVCDLDAADGAEAGAEHVVGELEFHSCHAP